LIFPTAFAVEILAHSPFNA